MLITESRETGIFQVTHHITGPCTARTKNKGGRSCRTWIVQDRMEKVPVQVEEWDDAAAAVKTARKREKRLLVRAKDAAGTAAEEEAAAGKILNRRYWKKAITHSSGLLWYSSGNKTGEGVTFRPLHVIVGKEDRS